jgi:DNA-binding beta-propeller fold protein YncE
MFVVAALSQHQGHGGHKGRISFDFLCVLCALCVGSAHNPATAPQPPEQRLLYVALPDSDAEVDRAIQILVFDIANSHTLVRRIALWPAPLADEAETVRGIAAHTPSRRVYVSTTKRLAAIDLGTDRIVWEKSYDGHCCERMAISPDGETIYAPAFGSPRWFVVHAATGELRASIGVTGWPRTTIYSRDGRYTFLGAWDSPVLSVADTARHAVVRTVGPFGGSVCPFTVNGKNTLAFANVDGLVGFEVGDLQTGLILDRVAVDGYDKAAAAPYECPSHGIAFAPGERELWVADGVRNRLHVFDAAVYPPAPLAAIELSAQPRAITFSVDGRYAYTSTGEVVDTTIKKISGRLEDTGHATVSSEHLVEIDFLDGRPIRSSP